ncbi:hypothetical protein [Sporanaerobacter sp. PP17-6a]|uniref:hypothetical protein n=1 Tax=Sporanaerobacter sp. PP17-6a TaxID=1891289 RepID=UPI00089FDFE7|nr:hypothetical protein [Sporanaerobacter sp. PP17-6a]SCL87942.1 hypothetical protein PP176A_1426 [Sporanaerobacter sp. PP17-6a]
MINTKKLASALKGVKNLKWLREGEFDYLTADYWGLKIPELKGADIKPLLRKFDTIPQEGETLSTGNPDRKPERMEEDKKFIKSILQIPKETKEIKYTKLLYQVPEEICSIFINDDKKYIFVNKRYTDLVGDYTQNFKILGTTPSNLIYFTDEPELLIICPYIKVKTEKINYLKEANE